MGIRNVDAALGVLLCAAFLLQPRFVLAGTEYIKLPSISAHLSAPTAVALDVEENIYVVESSRDRLLVFSPAGDHRGTLKGLSRPVSVAVDGAGKIYIGSAGKKSVEVYGPDLRFVGQLGSGDGEVGKPSSIAVDGWGRVYVVDSAAPQVRIYRPDGALEKTFGGPQGVEGAFQFPVAIAVDPTRGELFVTDLGSAVSPTEKLGGARVQVFDREGSFLREFGVFGVEEGMLVKPLGVAADDGGRVFVSDAFQNLIQIFDGNGVYLTTLFSVEDPLRTPLGMAYAKRSGKLYIASLSQGRIDVYALPGAPSDPFFHLKVEFPDPGLGVVRSAAPGVGCRETCATYFPSGETVTLTAEADPGFEFSGWDGDCAGAGPCELTMNADRSVAAHFVSAAAGRKASRDYNNDGLSDLLVWDAGTGAVSIWLTGENLQTEPYAAGETETRTRIEGVADFDGDGRADILLRDKKTGALSLWLMDGATVISAHAISRPMERKWQVAGVADFDGDGRADILLWALTGQLKTGVLSLWLMDGATVISTHPISWPMGRKWQVAGVADFDGDGGADILCRDGRSGAVSLLLISESAVDGRITIGSPADGGWEIAGVDDFNGDGRADILWHHPEYGSLQLWMAGDMQVVPASAAGTLSGGEWEIVGTGDFNGDGLADVVGRQRWTGEVVLWLMNGARILASVTVGAVPGGAVLW